MWLLATTVVLVTAAASGWPPLDGGRTWSRWDSATYMSIARDGYTLAPCQHIRGAWCGTTAWFPGYPWVVHTAHWLGLPIIATALAVSWLAFLTTLVLIWTVFLNQRPTVPAAAALLYAGFAPGVIYNYAIFPLALLSLCTVAFLALLHHERWRAAGLTGACAALVYPVGVVASPVAALWLLARRDIRLDERLRHTAVILGSWIGALALLVIDQRLETGRWNAFLLVQRNYRHHIEDPLSVLRAAFDNVLNKPPLGLAATSAAQTLLVTFVLLCVLIALRLQRKSIAPVETLVGVWAVAAWILPHVTTNLSVYRSEAALLPIAIVTWRLSRPLLALLVPVTMLLSIVMADLFFRGILK